MNTNKFNENYATLTPAYGRDYTSATKAKADFHANKDFVYARTGQYINKEQIATGCKINLRYKRLTAITVVTV